MAGPATLYQAGDHASRPANGAGCVLYTCSTHDKVYRDDGTTWTDFIDLATPAAVATFHGVRARTSGDTSLTSGSVVYVAFDAADEYDSDAYHDPASNNTRLTVPTGLDGYYAISAAAFTTPSPGNSYCVIRKNGTTLMANGNWGGDASTAAFTVACTLLLAAGDYVEFGIKVGAASKVATDAGVSEPFFEMHLVGS